MKNFILVTYFFLNFYLAGAFVIEIEVNYRTWLLIGVEEFPLYHQTLTRLLGPSLLVPLAIAVVLSWFMGLWASRGKDQYLFLLHALFITVFSFFSLLFMVPLHNQLSLAFDAEMIRLLIYRSALLRLPLQTLMILINCILLFRFLKPASEEQEQLRLRPLHNSHRYSKGKS